MSGKPCHRSQPLQPNFLLQMGFDVLAGALGDYRRQPSAAGPRAAQRPAGGPGVLIRGWLCTVASAQLRAIRDLLSGGRKQCIPPCSAAGPHDPSRDVPLATLSKDRTVEFRKAADKGTPLPSLSSSRPRMSRANAVGAQHPLVLVTARSNAGSLSEGSAAMVQAWRKCSPKQAFFDGSRGGRDHIENQRQ